MEEYVICFKGKKSIFWKKKKVTGHRYEREYDKMIMFKRNGAIEEIPEWSKKYVKLGVDFIAAQKKQIEKETGIEPKLSV